MIERIAAIIADLAENGIDGAGGLSLGLSIVIVVLVFAIVRAKMNGSEGD